MFKNCLKASRERGSYMILPTDGARACRPIGLDRRQLGLEDGHIVDHGDMKERTVTLEKN